MANDDIVIIVAIVYIEHLPWLVSMLDPLSTLSYLIIINP